MRASGLRMDIAPAIVFSSPSQGPDFSGLDIVAHAEPVIRDWRSGMNPTATLSSPVPPSSTRGLTLVPISKHRVGAARRLFLTVLQ
jgi:hypothetical protein